jgi:hypothetical protein
MSFLVQLAEAATIEVQSHSDPSDASDFSRGMA